MEKSTHSDHNIWKYWYKDRRRRTRGIISALMLARTEVSGVKGRRCNEARVYMQPVSFSSADDARIDVNDADDRRENPFPAVHEQSFKFPVMFFCHVRQNWNEILLYTVENALYQGRGFPVSGSILQSVYPAFTHFLIFIYDDE